MTIFSQSLAILGSGGAGSVFGYRLQVLTKLIATVTLKSVVKRVGSYKLC